ncbi:PREDICTED: ankyrin repeat and SAM domain-containing protein 6-like [Tarenaya hassleriana]|uniref:ankyrin repeat and SAM domain-containing protein 6-like n=1 Tax=Tarenaya hassleriana TaxID=28532 RepID=UPI00053C3B08|nr:PREDICTED: ankyrin repeat and SAM domain-containing protein 6-like [Tarenaya hassleriana]
MAELQPGNGLQPNCGVPPPETLVIEPPAEATAIGASGSVGSKRLRRPSVRLGDIGGDQYHLVPYDSQARRSKWKPSGNRKEPNSTGKSSRTRTLTNLGSGHENSGNLDEEREGNVDSMAVGSWRVKKRVAGPATTASTKRVRSNWVPKTDEIRNSFDHGDEKCSGGEDMEEGFRDFSREDSKSPMKEESHENSTERDDFYSRRRCSSTSRSRMRVFESRGFELSQRSDMDGGGGGGGGREGVKIWLEELGLGRYWPVFEINEVDEEVLPLLTLEDLKDMGINAVGTRRKMYCSIQKLGREFS